MKRVRSRINGGIVGGLQCSRLARDNEHVKLLYLCVRVKYSITFYFND